MSNDLQKDNKTMLNNKTTGSYKHSLITIIVVTYESRDTVVLLLIFLAMLPKSERRTRTAILSVYIKTNVFFWRDGFYLANQSNLKRIQKALIGWKKGGPPQKPLLF